MGFVEPRHALGLALALCSRALATTAPRRRQRGAARAKAARIKTAFAWTLAARNSPVTFYMDNVCYEQTLSWALCISSRRRESKTDSRFCR